MPPPRAAAAAAPLPDLFEPLALSYALAVLVSMVVALTVTPALALILLSGAPLDRRDAPLDPHFLGNGRCCADAEGRYAFFTIKPGAYPVPDSGRWWRPPHIHFSVLGPGSLSRLVTQMYFPGDPLNAADRIILSIPDAEARARLVARAVPTEEVEGEWLGFAHDMVLRGRHATPPLP